MPSKIESSLTTAEFAEFCRAVAQLPGGVKGPTLKEIQRVAGEWDVGYISNNSAKTFRDGAFKDFLDELKADRDFADDMATVAKEGSNLPEAAAHVLGKKVFKAALRLGDDVDPDTADKMTKSVERLRTGYRNGRRLESDLLVAAKKIEVAEKQLALRDEQIAKLTAEREERERKKADLLAKISAAAKSSGVITKETLLRIEQEAKLL